MALETITPPFVQDCCSPQHRVLVVWKYLTGNETSIEWGGATSETILTHLVLCISVVSEYKVALESHRKLAVFQDSNNYLYKEILRHLSAKSNLVDARIIEQEISHHQSPGIRNQACSESV